MYDMLFYKWSFKKAKNIRNMSYFGWPALVHQVNVLVSPDAKQPQTCEMMRKPVSQ